LQLTVQVEDWRRFNTWSLQADFE